MLPHEELQELTRDEAKLLAGAVALIEQKASGAAIRAAYAQLQDLRARKEVLLRDMGLQHWLRLRPDSGPSPTPGHRSGAGAAAALAQLESDERRKMWGDRNALH